MKLRVTFMFWNLINDSKNDNNPFMIFMIVIQSLYQVPYCAFYIN